MTSVALEAQVKRLLVLVLFVGIVGLWAGASRADSVSSWGATGQQCAPYATQGTSHTGGGLAVVLPATVDQLTDASSHVVVGRVKGFQSCLDRASGSITTQVVLACTQFLKASGSPGPTAAEVTIEVLGGEVGDIGMRAGTSPEFAVGEQAVLFLRDSGGVLRLTAGRQSKFPVTAAGLVKPLNLPLPEFKAKVRQAAQGALPLEEDPLAGGEPGPQLDYSIIARWAPSAMPVPYYINPNSYRPGQLTAQDTRLAVIGMFAEWQNVTSAYVAFRYAGDTNRTSDTFNCNSTNDITWRIADPGHNPYALAITYMCYIPSTGYFTDTDVEFDTDHYGSWWTVDPYDVELDLPTVMLHEEGHFLGLGHSDPTGGNCPVMKPSYSWGSVQRTPCTDDIAGVRYLYPEGSGSKPATPTGLTATPASETSVSVSWQNVASEYGYEVWRANKSCSLAGPADFALVNSVGADVTTYIDDWYGQGLPVGVYCYKVRAFNLNGESPFSNTNEASPGQTDVDGDGVPDHIDNCPETYNPDQDDYDGDGVPGIQPPPGATWGGDACDSDDDNDTVPDGEDADPFNEFICRDLDADTCDDCSLLGQPDVSQDGTDTDSDGICDDGDPDDDNDGFEDLVEVYVGTDLLDGCPDHPSHDAWPPDINRDTYINVLDVLLYKPVFLTQLGEPSYDPRFDINMDYWINVLDVLLYKPFFGTQCT
ncbi:MAG: matrixin family metalloprotease [Chloroflexota bacterium]